MSATDILAREERLLVTFPTTADAMLMEKLCREQKIEGRLIPLPPQVSAGCGMCWSAPVHEAERIQDLLKNSDVRAEQVTKCLI